MDSNVINDNVEKKYTANALHSISSLNKKLHWLLEIEKAYLDDQKINSTIVEGSAESVADVNLSGQINAIRTIDANTIENEGADPIRVNSNELTEMKLNYGGVNNIAGNLTSSNISELPIVYSTSRSIDLNEALKKPLHKEQAGYSNNSRSGPTSKEFSEVMSLLSENSINDSVRLFTGSDGVGIVIKCDESLSHAYLKMGHDIKHLLENRGNKVNSLVVNGKSLWSGGNNESLSQSDFNVVY